MLTYNEYKELFESHLLDQIPAVEKHASTVYEAMKYSLECGGKRLRPVLLLASCDLAGGDIMEAMPFACAIEYIHTYSLIHDDLPAMDNDDLRRGKPTNHKVFGEAMAVLAGDGLLNTACEAMSRDLVDHIDDVDKLKAHVMAAMDITKAAGINGMIGGQVCDVENEFNECTNDIIDFIEANKTGALLRAPVSAGLRIGGADAEMIANMDKYALCIGKAFQIADDILDFTSTPEQLGKSIGKDREQGKCNYVLVNGMDAALDKLHELTQEAVDTISIYGENADFFAELARKLEIRKA